LGVPFLAGVLRCCAAHGVARHGKGPAWMIELPNNAMQLTKGGWTRVEPSSSARPIVTGGKVVRPSQLIASVRRTVAGITMTRPTDVELARGYTVARYRTLEAARDRRRIADLVRRRFTDRYLAPMLAPQRVTHGFARMAIGCLMVEALESFRQGWPNSRDKSRTAFCGFFDAHSEFAAFRGHAERFYKDVRCGILHQAETRGGWKIHRRGPLFDADSRTVNATTFLRRLSVVLRAYCRQLSTNDWDSEVWVNCRKKLDALCKVSLS
jgi:hypothetical protein